MEMPRLDALLAVEGSETFFEVTHGGLQDLPDNFQVQSKVIMDNSISKSRELGPGNIGML